MSQLSEKTIEIDCAPGTPRPDAYINIVVADTGLVVKEPISKMFGNWVWDFSDVSDEQWQAAQPILKERIVALHESGSIRYGSW